MPPKPLILSLSKDCLSFFGLDAKTRTALRQAQCERWG